RVPTLFSTIGSARFLRRVIATYHQLSSRMRLSSARHEVTYPTCSSRCIGGKIRDAWQFSNNGTLATA
ncbi:MAG: hypothetical protein KDE03_16035, partial [Rhodobacteraceae bacterium]|nr:hypothetical protein [Paracoccaceae bacterium]